MMHPYDYRVDNERAEALLVCDALNLDPFEVNADGVDRWRVIAIDLAVLRIKLVALGVLSA